MIVFAFWSLVGISALEVIACVIVLGWAKLNSPGGTVFNLAMGVWTLVALLVWLKP